ncbi:hypothetical protein VTK26DRAFT_6691 [Humicola hyalothermophila]
MSGSTPKNRDPCPNCLVFRFDDGEPYVLRCEACGGAPGHIWPGDPDYFDPEIIPWPEDAALDVGLRLHGRQQGSSDDNILANLSSEAIAVAQPQDPHVLTTGTPGFPG